MRRRAGANERYHDRIAARYDSIYARDAYWEFYRAVTWEHLRRFIPADLSRPVLDAGCGTGEYGLRIAKSGYRVVLSDLSAAMLDRAKGRAEELGVAARVECVKADICDLSVFDDGAFSLVVAEGDPLSFCGDPRLALSEFRRVLVPGGALVASVDHAPGAIEHFLSGEGDPGELGRFLESGRTEWLARRAEERFPVKMFYPDEISGLVAGAGFAVRSMIAKTVLPLRAHPSVFTDRMRLRDWVAIESRLNSRRDLFGRASHLEIAGARPPE